MFFVGLSGFVLTSALCGQRPARSCWSPLGCYRGVAAGILTLQNSGLVQVLFQDAERGRAFGIFGATIGMATVNGPVLGGLILTAAGGPEGWGGLYVNILIGLVALV